MSYGIFKRLSIGGVSFAAAKDVEPDVVRGGTEITGTTTWGDGTSSAGIDVVAGKIGGCKIRLETTTEVESFASFIGKENLTIIAEIGNFTIQATGCIVASDGSKLTPTKGTSAEFDVVAQTGKLLIG
jgi:hypothetical protein